MSKDEQKERQRVTKDAKGDTCTSCEMLRIPCLYLDPTKKRGPPKGAGRYINAIEDRLHRMEAIVGGLVREDDPIFHSDEANLHVLLGNTTSLRNTGSRDNYDGSDMHNHQQQHQQQQQYLQHPDQPDLDSQFHPHPLQGYNSLLQQQQQQQQSSPLLMQYPRQQPYSSQQQSHPYPGPMLDMQFSQSPDMGSQTHPDGKFTNNLGGLTETWHEHVSISEVDDLDDDMGHLTIDQGGHERYVGKSSPLFYSGQRYGGKSSNQGMEPQTPESLRFLDNPDLPSPETITHLLNLHFTYVHPFAPVFIWSKFLRRLQDCDYTPSFLFLLNSIFALASRFSDDVSLRKDPTNHETVGVRFAEKAKEILDTLYDSPDLNCVGGLVLLAFQQMGTGHGYKSWMYIGISIRMAQHLGLHRNCLKINPAMPALEREERNRIWWTCFMADRINSASFGRPQGINEHDVDATYPEGIDEENIRVEYRLEGATSTLTGPSLGSEENFVYSASLMRILGRVMVSLYSPISKASSKCTTSMTNPAPLEQLDKELTDWLLTLPPHLQFRSVQQEPGTFVCMLHMTFYAVLILLHRPYSHKSVHNTPNDPSMSMSICTSAANNAIEMASNMMRAIDEKRGTPRLRGLLQNSVFIFFTAGLVHITNCTSTDPELAASAKLRTIEVLRCLAIIEDVWISSRVVSDNIKNLLKVRNIELPYSTEAFKNLPLGSVDELKKKLVVITSQADVLAPTVPKEQCFAFDIDQIMGYYQATGAKRIEPIGRNSRHFSPTPYFSSVSGQHHYHHSQVSMKSHPGLTQGHSPLPRRPRQTKNSSPTPLSSVTSTPISISNSVSTPRFYSNSNDAAVGGAQFFNNSNTDGNSGYSVNDSGNNNSQIDPFAVPGSATLGSNVLQQQQQNITPIEAQQPLDVYPNPFSASLWALPSSMDNEEWMQYMQNNGGNSEHALGLSVQSGGYSNSHNNIRNDGVSSNSNSNDNSIGIKSEATMYNSIGPDHGSGSLDQNSANGMAVNGVSGNNFGNGGNNKLHPLAQCLTRSELLGGGGDSGEADCNITRADTPVSVQDHPSPANQLSTSNQQQQQQQHTINQQQQPSEFYFMNGTMSMGNT
ncbi:hypothetical protein BGX27_010774 [Mortierella sp. AM989]|nr:hypothetical protein BGX27_010774 [Mortierella sp. AM989]